MKVRGWVASDVGRKRDHNEDSFLCSDDIGIYAVADGMGGHLGGERASRMAVDILESEMRKAQAAGLLREGGSGPGGGNGLSPTGVAMRAALQAADAAIYELAHEEAELSGMGTTLTGLAFHGDRLTLCHVGDSRAFVYRDGKARQLSEDHSWIQEQVRAGLLSLEEAKESRFRNIITRSVGFEPLVEPDVLTLPVQAGDCYVLCSDGLSNYLGADEFGQILTSQFYKNAPQTFVDTANERGGDDNITCVVMYVANEP